MKERLAKISALFLTVIISILLVADLITNWIMLIIADREIAINAAHTSLIFSILILVCTVVKIVLRIWIHITYSDYYSEESMCLLINFSVLFAIIGALLIVRTLGWYNQLALQVLFPTHGLITFLLIVYIVNICSICIVYDFDEFYYYF